MYNFDFSKEPGKELKRINFEKRLKPVVSIITPFYNDKKYIMQTVNSVLNSTYQIFSNLKSYIHEL